MKNSENNMEFLDLRDAAENLALSQHLLVRELLKSEIKIWVRFDEISSRMVKIIPPKDNQKYIDYRINPGDIHCLTMDSSKRIERMLEKSELVFQGLRLEIDFGGYLLTLKIVEDDPGMHLVVNKKDLDLISKLPNKIGLLDDQHRKTRKDLYLSIAQSNDEFVPIEVAADQNGCGWKTMVYKTIEEGEKIYVRIYTWAQVLAVKSPDPEKLEGWLNPNEIQTQTIEELLGFDSGLFYLEPTYQREFLEVQPPWEPYSFCCPAELIKKLRRPPEPEEKLFVMCSGEKYDKKSLFIKKDVQQNIKLQPEYTKSKFSKNHDTTTKRAPRKSHPKIDVLFWRTYQMLTTTNQDHSYKDVWDAIYDEWVNFEKEKYIKIKNYDPDDIVEKMDPSKKDNAHVNFYIMEGNCSVSFKLSSLSSKLSKLKNTPPKT